jgi:hypothetical protein
MLYNIPRGDPGSSPGMTRTNIPLSYTGSDTVAPSAVDPRCARMTAMNIPLHNN